MIVLVHQPFREGPDDPAVKPIRSLIIHPDASLPNSNLLWPFIHALPGLEVLTTG